MKSNKKYTAIFNQLVKLYKQGKLTKLTDDQRETLYVHCNFTRIKEKGIKILDGSEQYIKNEFDKSIKILSLFVAREKLIYTTYRIDYYKIYVYGYKEMSDKDLIDRFAKQQEKHNKYTRIRKKSGAKNKAEASQEINRLKKQFKFKIK